MSSVPYNICQFLPRIAGLSLAAMQLAAEKECADVERTLYGVRGAPKRRDQGGVEYVTKLKELLFFLQSRTRPGGASAGEFAMYKPLAVALVEGGEFPPEVLKLFG